ncbi:MAG: hypothetical protein Ct9H300mP15_05980 [Gemmatimonadota bacterium]|nr:MAG: hypothetical protein Ct9H300mP15_05980 [Gemmatimonadota bacterium]
MTPHGPFLGLAAVSAFLFAVLDAWVYVLLIPFVETLFSRSGAPGLLVQPVWTAFLRLQFTNGST